MSGAKNNKSPLHYPGIDQEVLARLSKLENRCALFSRAISCCIQRNFPNSQGKRINRFERQMTIEEAVAFFDELEAHGMHFKGGV